MSRTNFLDSCEDRGKSDFENGIGMHNIIQEGCQGWCTDNHDRHMYI